MGPLQDEDFEAAARRLRIKLGIDDQLRPDMITVVIKLKDHGMIANYVRVPDEDMPDDEAFFEADTRLLYSVTKASPKKDCRTGSYLESAFTKFLSRADSGVPRSAFCVWRIRCRVSSERKLALPRLFSLR